MFSHRDFDLQMDGIQNMRSNMTGVLQAIATSQEKLDTKTEAALEESAQEFFKEHDKNMNMDSIEQAKLFDEQISEFRGSINRLNKKFQVIESKTKNYHQ